MTNKPMMTNMTAEQWDAIAEAVDALSGALSAVNPRLNPEPEPLAEWERELLSPFPAGLTVSEDGVALNWRGVNYVRQSEPEPFPTGQWVWHAGRLWEACNDNGTPYYTNAAGDIRDYPAHVFDGPTIPVRPVPVAEFDALKEKVLGFDAARSDRQWRVVVARAAELFMDATDSLGLDA